MRGSALAALSRPDVLRTALNLAKAAHKLARPGVSISLDESEVRLLIEALRFTADEVRWAAHAPENDHSARRDAVLRGFPELVERGVWRGFGLSREMDELTTRLTAALAS